MTVMLHRCTLVIKWIMPRLPLARSQTADGNNIIIIIIIPCKPYLSASATAPHPLGRRKVERLFSLFSV
jgi:hypothetical protein